MPLPGGTIADGYDSPVGTSAAKPPIDRIGFLLSQLGHRAATLFAELLLPLDLTPPLAGIIRLVARQPGLSQQELAQRLGLLPSRVVAFVDNLEARGLVSRERNETDRRLYALHLTDRGRDVMTSLGGVAREQDRRLTKGLTGEQRTALRAMLAQMAEAHGLTPSVHPGYRGPSSDEPLAPARRGRRGD
jgi:DNA-binding MarR family transcriptional regulator